MQLLISVSSGDEAAAAMAGGADIIDAKDPAAGPLGAVTIDVLREISRTIDTARLLTAALGDALHEDAVEHMARSAALAGAMLVKVGFAGTDAPGRAAALLRAAMRGANATGDGSCGVVAVAYADANEVASLDADDLLEAAAAAGAAGVLLDTANKNGRGLRGLWSQPTLAGWVARAHEAGLMTAVAGRLQIDDLGFVRDAGADVAGVRGAACDGGRTGRISSEKVRALVARTLSGSRGEPSGGAPAAPARWGAVARPTRVYQP